MSENTGISLIIPVRDEAENLPFLFNELKENLSDLKNKLEVIVVDDGSIDHSGKVAEKEIKKWQIKGKVIYLISTLGKGAALETGFKKAQGKTIITLDADLQDDPKEIKKLLKKIEEGFDGVVGYRQERLDKIYSVIYSRIFNFLVRLFTGVKLHDINCGLKAFRKEALINIQVYKGLYRFIPVFVAWKKFKVCEVKVNHRQRKFGKSKYSPLKAIDGFFDLFLVTFLVRFSLQPFRFFGLFGFSLFSMGFLMTGYLTVLRLMGQTIGRRPLLIFAAIFLIGGIQLISLGFLGELIRMNNPQKYSPIVKKEVGFNEN